MRERAAQRVSAPRACAASWGQCSSRGPAPRFARGTTAAAGLKCCENKQKGGGGGIIGRGGEGRKCGACTYMLTHARVHPARTQESSYQSGPLGFFCSASASLSESESDEDEEELDDREDADGRRRRCLAASTVGAGAEAIWGRFLFLSYRIRFSALER